MIVYQSDYYFWILHLKNLMIRYLSLRFGYSILIVLNLFNYIHLISF